MAVSEQALVELRTRLEQVLGTEEAATLMDHLPSDQPATRADLRDLSGSMDERFETSRADLRDLSGSMDERFEAVDQRFEAVDQRFEAVDRRFDAVDRRFDAVDHRFSIFEVKLEELEKRLGIRIDALADSFEQRGETLEQRAEAREQHLLAAISGVREDFAMQLIAQTRVFVFSTISALITLAALTLAFVGT